MKRIFSLKPRFGLAFYLGLFGIGTGLISFFTDLLAFGGSFFLLSVEYNKSSFEFFGIATVSCALMLLSLGVFSLCIACSVASLIMNYAPGIRRESRKGIKGFLIAVIVILVILAAISVLLRALFSLSCVLAGIIGFESDYILIMPFIEVISALGNVVCGLIMNGWGFAAVRLSSPKDSGKSWIYYAVAITGLLLTPILAFLFSAAQAVFILSVSLLMSAVALVALMALFGLLAS